MNAKFHALREDIETVGEFIRMYQTRTTAGASPSFSPARATARPGPPGWPATCRSDRGIVLQRRDPGLVDASDFLDRSLRTGQRPAADLIPAYLRGDRLVSQASPGRSPGHEPEGGARPRSRGFALERLCRRPSSRATGCRRGRTRRRAARGSARYTGLNQDYIEAHRPSDRDEPLRQGVAAGSAGRTRSLSTPVHGRSNRGRAGERCSSHDPSMARCGRVYRDASRTTSGPSWSSTATCRY